jgi:putative ABC transport system permease protein
VESTTGTVQPDFLSGIYGGISMAQYRQIQQIPGVQVAVPIAMVGYAQLNANVFVPMPAAALAGSGRQLFRISTTFVNDKRRQPRHAAAVLSVRDAAAAQRR